MKVLYHHRIGSKDGQYVHIAEMIHALEQEGAEVVMVGPRAVDQQSFGGESGWVSMLKRRLPQALYELLELGYSVLDYLKLRRAIREHAPDVIYERYNLYFVSGVWAHRRFGLPLLLEVNAPLLDERSRYSGIALPSLARWSERRAWRGADRVYAVTRVLARRIAQEGVEETKLSITPNGIDPDQFASLPSREAAKQHLGLSGRVVLGFTGFVREWHGMDTMLDLMAAHPELNLHLLLVGDGPARAALEAQAEQLGLADRVTFTGVVERDQVPLHVMAFDVALQPAVVPYASPLKLFEYLAAGCAVVAPASENIREILSDGINALLFDPEQPEQRTAAILQLARDEALRTRLGEAAARTIAERGLTWQANARTVLEDAQRLLANPSRAQVGRST
ncbi:glycosyltransferase WbuB [Acidihalobacter aeolianus]|uniref:Glycosyltransferase WbuB n=1 Tax=Acidihalobacter aeolianus TaxID=2792603 RepID=A0A1D8K780_9GAMM|nr:glycosyltransferase family 4 protein [Acidihalobacter aeolianus]AOV16824.1 glycosyltransferase WbuB [Acidihalobacter aeolianus]